MRKGRFRVSWAILAVMVFAVTGMLSCNQTADYPWGFIIFYDGANLTGNSYVVGFNNSSGAVKWDKYDFEGVIGNDTISSFEVFVNKPTTVILCAQEHFRNRYARFNVTAVGQWVAFNNLSEANVDNITSALIATNEDPNAFILDDTNIPFLESVALFRTKIKEKMESKKDVEAVDLWRTQVLWDTKLNVFNHAGYLAYDPANENEKNDDLIQFYQRLDLDPNWWPSNYEVKLFFWVEPANFDGNMGFSGWAWEYWVEGGLISGKIASSIEAGMPENLSELATTIDTEVRKRMLPYEDQLTHNINRISFTLPDQNDATQCNNFAGVGCGAIESTPPIVILQHKY